MQRGSLRVKGGIVTKKKNVLYYIIGFGIILIGLIVFSFAYFGDRRPNGNSIAAYVYFVTELNTIDSEEYFLPMLEEAEMAGFALDRFREGSTRNPSAPSPMPDDLELLEPPRIRSNPEDMKFTFVVNFSREYYDMEPVAEKLFRGALVWTLTDLEFINGVEILVDNESLNNSIGIPFDMQSRANIDIRPEISPHRIANRVTTLYFADETGTRLLPEERVIEFNLDLPAEQFIMEQVIVGPRLEGRYPTVHPEVRILDVRNDGDICFINLSADFLIRSLSPSVSDEVIVYSVVNSLMEVPQVIGVQILVEAETVTEPWGNEDIDLSRQFERNYSIVDYDYNGIGS